MQVGDVLTCRDAADRTRQRLIEEKRRNREFGQGPSHRLLDDAVDASLDKHSELPMHKSSRPWENGVTPTMNRGAAFPTGRDAYPTLPSFPFAYGDGPAGGSAFR
jgi:hypothetical protein